MSILAGLLARPLRLGAVALDQALDGLVECSAQRGVGGGIALAVRVGLQLLAQGLIRDGELGIAVLGVLGGLARVRLGVVQRELRVVACGLVVAQRGLRGGVGRFQRLAVPREPISPARPRTGNQARQ